jgi:hypothetical protein
MRFMGKPLDQFQIELDQPKTAAKTTRNVSDLMVYVP